MAVSCVPIYDPIALALRADSDPFVLLQANFSTGVVSSSALTSKACEMLTERLGDLFARYPTKAELFAGFAEIVSSMVQLKDVAGGATVATSVSGNVVTLTVSGQTSPAVLLVSIPHSTSSAWSIAPATSRSAFGANPATVDVAAAQAVQPVIGTLAPNVTQPVTLQLAAGTYDGFSLQGFQGGGVGSDGQDAGLTVAGAVAEVAPGSGGASSGTAGAGTGPTSLVKPLLALNWVANELQGYILQITAGAGAGQQRSILSNTINTVTVETIAGMDDTSVFRIVTPSTYVQADPSALLASTYAILAANNTAPIVFKNLRFTGPLDYLVYSARNASVRYEGCYLDVQGAVYSIYSTGDGNVKFANCTTRDGAQVQVSDAKGRVSVSGGFCHNGGYRIDNAQQADVQLEATANTMAALYGVGIQSLTTDIYAYSNLTTPVVFDSIGVMNAVGTRKLTGSGNTGYGVSINKAGRYFLTGCTITGTLGDIDFDNSQGDYGPATWADLASGTYGVMMRYGSTLVGAAGQNKALNRGAYTNLGTQEDSARYLGYGFFNGSQQVGLEATGSSQADALQLGQFAYNRFDTVAANTGCRLPDAAVLPGCDMYVDNRGLNALKVYAEDAGATVKGAVFDSVPAGSCYHYKSAISSAGHLSWSRVGA